MSNGKKVVTVSYPNEEPFDIVDGKAVKRKKEPPKKQPPKKKAKKKDAKEK